MGPAMLMAETRACLRTLAQSYSDPGVISYINEHYVPVRVDNDQRPDINARYNMGGWPTTAFLTPEGELMTGGTYIPPEAMREHLPRIAAQYNSSRDEIAQAAKILDWAQSLLEN